MKTVSGKLTSTRPVTLSTASKVLSKFITVDNGASPAISIYLRRASEAFEELNQLHKSLRAPKSDRKSRKASALSESVDAPPRETETEDAERDHMKHSKKKNKKAVDGDYADDGLVEGVEDSRRTVGQESANGNGKPVGSEGKKKKRKSKDKQLNGEVGNAIESIAENGEEKGEDGNINEAERANGIKKKKKNKKRGGDADAGTEGNGIVEEDRDRGRKRKIEVAREAGEENGSTDQPSKKKKKR